MNFFQTVVLDQGLEADLIADIQKNLEDLLHSGLRQRLINLTKVFISYSYILKAFG